MLQWCTVSRLRPALTWPIAIPLIVAVILGLWLANDGRHHWDEPGYLYAGAYQPTAEIISGHVQPSGIPHFMQGRILHVLITKGVMAISGSGPAGFRAMVALNLLLLAASLALIHQILKELMPDVPQRGAAVAFLAISPVILYLAYRTLADGQSLVAALVATLALVRIAHGGGLHYAAIAAFALALSALTKNQMAFLPAAGWAALCLVPFGAIDRRRLAIVGAASGIAGIAIAIVTLDWLGVGVGNFVASYRGLADTRMPLVAKVLNIGTEFGAIWLLLPLALLTKRRRELAAFALWFVLAMVPFVFIVNSIEARHVAVNLVAAGGLLALGFEALPSRCPAWGRLSVNARGAVVALAATIVLASNVPILSIMPHRVNLPQMRAMLDQFDGRYGAGNYVLLTAAGYTDFQLIRVLWPDVDVRDASTAEIAVHDSPLDRRAALDAYLGGRVVDSVDELRTIGKPAVYLGYRKTFASENMHALVSHVSPSLADRLLGSVDLVDRLRTPWTAWLWQRDDVALEPIGTIGHYHAFEVKLSPP